MTLCLYLSGAMTNRPQFNRPMFVEWAARLRALDYEVVSPVEQDDADGVEFTEEQLATGTCPPDVYERLLARDVALLEGCDALILLPDCDGSAGVRREILRARELGLPVYWTEELLAIHESNDAETWGTV